MSEVLRDLVESLKELAEWKQRSGVELAPA